MENTIMKKIKQIVLALVAAVTLFGCKSQVSKDVQIEPETINLRNIESAITEMEKTHQNAIQNLFDEISKSDFHELNRSIFFKEQNNNSRNESSSFDYLTDEEEDFIIENMTEEEKEVILQTVQFYLDEYAEIAKIRVFDTENKPEGLIETDDEIILGDIVFSKLTPEGLSQVYELAKTYYGVDIADRGAFLGTNPTPNSILMFKSGWVNNTIPYAFDGFPSNYKSDMRKCMKEWETGSANAIKFNEVKSFNWWRNIWWNLGTLKVLKISQEDLDKNVLGQATYFG